MTIAPTEPASDAEVEQSAVTTRSVPTARGGGEDGPGAALLRTLTELTEDLTATDPGKVAAAALRGRHAGSDEAELRQLAIDAAAGLIGDEPQYSRLAARLLTLAIAEEAAGQGATSFAASVATGHREGLIADVTAAFVAATRRTWTRWSERALRGRRRRPVRLLRPADRALPLPAPPPDHPPGDRDPAALPAAGGLRPGRGRPPRPRWRRSPSCTG